MDTSDLGQRIKVYRIAAGLSLRDLARIVPVSPQALSQYETGRVRPRKEILEALTSVLGTSVAQLARKTESSTLGSIEIQHLQNLNSRTLDKTRGSLVTLLNQCLALEHRVGGVFPSPSLPRITEIRAIHRAEEAESIAQEVRQRWGLASGPLPSLVALFETRGIRIFDTLYDEDTDVFRSCSALVSLTGRSALDLPVILLNSTLWSEHKRFALGQELAHLILPSSMTTVLPKTMIRKFSEWFSSALLLPAAALREILGRKRSAVTWFEMGELKRHFGISYRAIARRCHDIGIINHSSYRKFLDTYKLQGWNRPPYREHFAIDPIRESSTRLRRLSVRALAEGVVTLDEATTLLDVEKNVLRRWLEPNAFESQQHQMHSDA